MKTTETLTDEIDRKPLPSVLEFWNDSSKWKAICPHCGQKTVLQNYQCGSVAGLNQVCAACGNKFFVAMDARYVDR